MLSTIENTKIMLTMLRMRATVPNVCADFQFPLWLWYIAFKKKKETQKTKSIPVL